MSGSRRKLLTQCLIAGGLLVVGAAVAGGVVGYLDAADAPASALVVWIIAGAAVLLMVGALAISAMWMRSIDEAAREAHKAAWFWGGSAGMALGGALIILSLLPGAEALALPAFWMGRSDPAAYAASGAFAILMLMITGYSVVWAWWWLARR